MRTQEGEKEKQSAVQLLKYQTGESNKEQMANSKFILVRIIDT